jgi:hypothetical protein
MLLVPCGVAIAVGAAIAWLLPPRWIAGGLPFALGYPKNLDLAAAPAGVVAGALTVCLASRRRWYAVAVAVALVGAAIAAVRVSAPAAIGPPAAWGPSLLVVAVCAGLIWSMPAAVDCAGRRGPRWPLVILVGPAAAVGLWWCASDVRVDTMHDGGTLLAATRLLRGERPFRDMLLAHGLHDAGIAALWMRVLGKVGTSPVVLTLGSNAMLCALTLYLVTRRAVAGTAAALAGAAVAVAVLVIGAAPRALFLALGLSVFVAATYCLLRPGAAWRGFAAGIALGVGHLYRIDVSLFGAGAAAAVLGVRWLAWGREGPATRLAGLARDGLLVALGALAPLALVHGILGWPDAAWVTHVFGVLRRYHPDSDGLPMPWPLPIRGVAPWTVASSAPLLAPLLLALVLAAAALRSARVHWRGARAAPPASTAEALTFLAVFAVLALRTTLTRSDPGHALMWTPLPLVGALALLLSRPLARCAAEPRASAWGAAGATLALIAYILHVHPDRPLALREHLSANPPQGGCREAMLTPGDASRIANRGLIEASCTVERALRAHGIGALVIDHAAPWYTVRFGLEPVTAFYVPGKAYTPAMQEELVADLRAAPRSALLRVRGYQALDRFDVENALRIPVVEAYLRERRRGAPVIASGIGDLVLWDEPAPSEPPTADGIESADIAVFVDRQTYDPASRFLVLEGWAADTVGPRPVDVIAAVVDGVEETDARRDLPRPDAAAFLGAAELVPGWALVVRIPPWRWPTAVTVHARMADGRQRAVVTDPARATILPAMDDAAWSDLAARVDRAAAQGRADRAARCRWGPAAERPPPRYAAPAS